MSGPLPHPNAAYPSWLPKPVIPVTVVIGPLGNGARAYVDAAAGAGDIVIDLQDIIAELAGVPSFRAGPEWMVPGFGRRNAMLADLAAAPDAPRAWLITQAPRPWQRQFWATALAADLVELVPPKDQAIVAARNEGWPEKYVHMWYSEATSLEAPRTIALPGPRPSAEKRGYGNEHRVLRDRQLAREPCCRFCLAEGRGKVVATVLDHIEPFRDANGDFVGKLWGDPKNHRSLCGPCHDARGARRNRPEKPPGAAADGRPLDPGHPWSRPRI